MDAGDANVYFDVEMPNGQVGHVVAGVDTESKDVVEALNRAVKAEGAEAVHQEMLGPDGLTL